MPQLTTQAEQYEPTGDPDHVAYGQDFIWSCSCGQSGNFVTSKNRATGRAEQHEQYCSGHTTVDTVWRSTSRTARTGTSAKWNGRPRNTTGITSCTWSGM